MATTWTVKYQAPKDKNMQYAYVEAPDDLKTAKAVQNAIEKGEIGV